MPPTYKSVRQTVRQTAFQAQVYRDVSTGRRITNPVRLSFEPLAAKEPATRPPCLPDLGAEESAPIAQFIPELERLAALRQRALAPIKQLVENALRIARGIKT